MSGLTPEAALRVSAEHLSKMHGESDMVLTLIAEADRLEAAAKTPGQVLATIMACDYSVKPRWWDDHAAAVIAHHVGPDRVVVDQADVKQAVDACALNGYTTTAIRLREALS